MTSPSAPTEYPEGTQRVAAALAVAGLGHQPVLLPVTGRTAQDAADALGVELGQIAKSIVFRRVSDDADGDRDQDRVFEDFADATPLAPAPPAHVCSSDHARDQA